MANLTSQLIVQLLDKVSGPARGVANSLRGISGAVRAANSAPLSFSDRLDAAIDPAGAADVGAAVDALARGSEDIVAAVPDLADFAEAAQGAMIKAMSARRRRVLLLSRPVAAFLDLLHRGHIGWEVLDARFRLLIHTAAGFEDQVLTLRADPNHPGHFAPQRDGPGRLSAAQIGLDAVFARANDFVRKSNAQVDWSRCEPSRLGPALVCGLAAAEDTEVLRARNGTWVVVTAPELDPEALGIGAIDVPPVDVAVAATFLVTPQAGRLAQALVEAVSRSVGPVNLRTVASWVAPASGKESVLDDTGQVTVAGLAERETVT